MLISVPVNVSYTADQVVSLPQTRNLSIYLDVLARAGQGLTLPNGQRTEPSVSVRSWHVPGFLKQYPINRQPIERGRRIQIVVEASRELDRPPHWSAPVALAMTNAPTC